MPAGTMPTPAAPPAPAPPVQTPAPGLTTQQAAEAYNVLAELARRRIESLRLYESLPVQEAFHASTACERVLRGSNRGGKTLPAAVEVARAVCGLDPHGKYPAKEGRCYAIGKDGRHIGQVMWRKLSRAGAFRIIRDAVTGEWRAYRPWIEADAKRIRETRLAPPLIPPRLIKSIAWENKKENHPSQVSLHTGWEINFFSSLGKPPQGADLDLVWFDEEIVDPEWYGEMSARLLDRAGKFFWSATPQAGTERLYDLHERCEDERGKEQPAAEEYVILLADNPHITEAQKRDFAAKIGTPEEAAVRIGGEFAISTYKVYPEFAMSSHGVPWFEIPRQWSRFAVVDPGHQVCAVLFAAVPPPAEGDYVYLYDELYLKNCDAERFGRGMAEKTSGQQFWVFLIDGRAGRATQIGVGKTVEEQYRDALVKNRVVSVRTGSGFIWGSDDVDGGISAVRSWLRTREDGPAKMRVLEHRCPNLEWEIKRYHHRRERGGVTDKPDNRRNNHLVDCLRYLAMYAPRYHKPKEVKAGGRGIAAIVREKRKKRREQQGGSYVRLG